MPGGEKRTAGRASHHEELCSDWVVSPHVWTTGLSLIAVWGLIGATPRGQPWTPAVTLPPGRDGLSARRMAVLWTFREPSLGRHVHRELMRNAVLTLTLIIPTTACHQRNYVERYSRFTRGRTSTLCVDAGVLAHSPPQLTWMVPWPVPLTVWRHRGGGARQAPCLGVRRRAP